MTTGINIDDKFIVSVEDGKAKVKVNGEVNADSGTFSGYLKIPFKTFGEGAVQDPVTKEYTVSDSFNLQSGGDLTKSYLYVINLPTDGKYVGTVLTIYDYPVKTRASPVVKIKGKMYHPLNIGDYGLKLTTEIDMGRGGTIQFLAVTEALDRNNCTWQVLSDCTSGGSFS